MTASALNIKVLIQTGVILPGDTVVAKGKMEALRWFIERAQLRLLKAVFPEIGEYTLKDYAGFTHAFIVENSDTFIEMYRPSCRRQSWEVIPEGTELVIRRPIKATREQLQTVVELAKKDIEKKMKYSIFELFRFYLWSLGIRKNWLGRLIIKDMESTVQDTCATRTVVWDKQAGIKVFERAKPEDFFPARVIADHNYYTSITSIKI